MMNLTMETAMPWRWLAGVFAAPLDADALAESRADTEQFEAMAQYAALAPGLRRMRDALANLPAGTEGVSTLAHAYTLLFSGAGGPDTVPPYESAFTTPNGRLFGAAEARMRALLGDLDLRVADGLGEPADHIAIELAAMAELAGAAARPPQRAALARSLQDWLGGFRDACAAHDPHGFYAGAATVAVALAGLEAASAAAGEDAKSPGEPQ
jgi:TorA-specific chaperone